MVPPQPPSFEPCRGVAFCDLSAHLGAAVFPRHRDYRTSLRAWARNHDGTQRLGVSANERWNMRLLLVEPHSVLARSLKRGLVEEGFAVDHVRDNNAAHKRMTEESYQVIILDLAFDSMLETLRAWRCAELPTPVMLLSEPGRGLDQCEALRTENCDTCMKPFALESLLARLHNLVQMGDHHQRESPKDPWNLQPANDLSVVRSSATRYTLPVT
jgi:DNA-binding NtrC family response regulator